MSPFMGPLIPLFWTSGDVSSGFQDSEWAALLELCGDTDNRPM